jgi:hypothetical protein
MANKLEHEATIFTPTNLHATLLKMTPYQNSMSDNSRLSSHVALVQSRCFKQKDLRCGELER